MILNLVVRIRISFRGSAFHGNTGGSVFQELPQIRRIRISRILLRTYPNGHALGDRVPTAFTGPSRPLLHMRLKAFAGQFGVCYQVVTRTTWQLAVAVSDSHLKSISSQIAAAAVAPSRATTRCPASLLASRRTYTALYRIYPHQRVSRYKTRLIIVHLHYHHGPLWPATTRTREPARCAAKNAHFQDTPRCPVPRWRLCTKLVRPDTE